MISQFPSAANLPTVIVASCGVREIRKEPIQGKEHHKTSLMDQGQWPTQSSIHFSQQPARFQQRRDNRGMVASLEAHRSELYFKVWALFKRNLICSHQQIVLKVKTGCVPEHFWKIIDYRMPLAEQSPVSPLWLQSYLRAACPQTLRSCLFDTYLFAFGGTSLTSFL